MFNIIVIQSAAVQSFFEGVHFDGTNRVLFICYRRNHRNPVDVGSVPVSEIK